jgi:hypothetical protein
MSTPGPAVAKKTAPAKPEEKEKKQ